MEQIIQSIIICRSCGGSDLQKNGKTDKGKQQYHCKDCGKYFQKEYSYNAYNHNVDDDIVRLTLSNCGVRDVGKFLKISKDTVCRRLKKNSANESICKTVI